MSSRNYLLVIAIDKYDATYYPPLHNSKLDALRLVKNLSDRFGFELVQEPILDDNATRKNIVEAINHLSSFLTKTDNIIIYFAGHGAIHPKTKKGYWIPTDAKDSISDQIPNSTIIDSIEGIEAKHIFLISDSCFSGTFLTQNRSSPERHYLKLDAHRSRWVLASGREEAVSDGQPGVGSPFSIALNNFLENEDIKVFSASELALTVSKNTGNSAKQQPISSHIEGVGHDGGQLIFRSTREGKSVPSHMSNGLSEIVVSFETALELQGLNLPQNGFFAYYKIEGGQIVKKYDGAKDFICTAYLFDEVSKLIPDEIEVKPVTYLARSNRYDKLNVKSWDYVTATVQYERTGVHKTPFIAVCRCKGTMVAFSRDDDGSYNNLITWGHNQAEASALMLLRLYDEGKVQISVALSSSNTIIFSSE